MNDTGRGMSTGCVNPISFSFFSTPRVLQNRAALSKTASVNKTATFGLGPGQWKIRDEKHAANLLENMRSLRDQSQFTDMTISYDYEVCNFD